MLFAQGISKRFRVGGTDLEVLKSLDIQVEAGEIVGLTGPSGAGKSTFLQILGGLDMPDSGTVEVDGLKLNELSEDELARFRNRQIGFVFQFHHLLAEFTALENVMMPLLVRGESQEEAAKPARELLGRIGMSSRLDHLPSELSGGEGQRVAIARAFLKDAPILILDEATSHLDAVNEQAVRRALEELMADRTTLVIAHRLSTVRSADKIVALDQGQVIESGTHDELLARGGLYAQLVAHQLAGAAGRSAA